MLAKENILYQIQHKMGGGHYVPLFCDRIIWILHIFLGEMDLLIQYCDPKFVEAYI